ncbi:MAG: sulfite exporter TauE/SafE family protein [Hyphomicrobiaceae bacterium]
MIDSIPFPDLSTEAMALACVAFLVAGLVKGTLGGGLPAIAVPIMITMIRPSTAAALSFVPVVATNIWLLTQGGLFTKVIRLYWPFLCMLALGTALGSQVLVSASPETMRIVIAVMVIVLSPLPLLPHSFKVPEKTQRWLNPVMGLVLGTIGGATVMMAPVIIYFVALRIDKELFVSSMGAIALSSMTPLFIGLAAHNVLAPPELVGSALVFIPTAIGMSIGTRLRGRLSQTTFQRLLCIALLLVGFNLLARAL